MTTFYANSAGVQGTGDGSSEANACTLAAAITNTGANANSLVAGLAAGDVIYCKAGTTITYNGSGGNFVAPSVTGTVTAPIRVIGYSSTIGDDGVVNLQDSDAGANNNCFDLSSVSYWRIANFKITNPRRGFDFGVQNGNVAINCEVVGSTVYAFATGANSGDVHSFVCCYAHDGTGPGFYAPGRTPRLAGCVAENMTGTGFTVGNPSYGVDLVNCLAFDNGGDGFAITGEVMPVNCLSYNNGGDGYQLTADGPHIFINSGAGANGAYGIEGASGTKVHAITCGLNPTNEANVSGKNSSNVTLYEIGAISGDPLFADAANGDFSLGAASAWKAAGASLGGAGFTASVTYTDLGPVQREEPAGGGGGGLLVHPGLTGGMRG